MELGKAFTDSIIVGERHRPLDAGKVDELAESIKVLGLQQPISVYVDEDDAAYLVAGRHRLAAARQLGWEQIDATFVDLSPTRREMWEIAENLYRAPLTKEQRDEHIRRYAELLERDEAEQKEFQVRQDDAPEIGYKKPPPQKRGTASKIAEQTGISTRTVQRALNPKPISPPDRPHNPNEAYNKWASDMNRLWSRASREWREQWLASVDEPTMDRAGWKGEAA